MRDTVIQRRVRIAPAYISLTLDDKSMTRRLKHSLIAADCR